MGASAGVGVVCSAAWWSEGRLAVAGRSGAVVLAAVPGSGLPDVALNPEV
jgi:hypothetical protein